MRAADVTVPGRDHLFSDTPIYLKGEKSGGGCMTVNLRMSGVRKVRVWLLDLEHKKKS